MKSSILKIVFLKIFLIFVIPLFSQEKTDYLIISNLKGLEILNRYQQKISEKDKSAFSPYLPCRIIQREMLLSDGFTSAMEVSIEKQTFFLLLNEEKEPIITDPETEFKIIDKSVSTNEMLKVRKTGKVRFAKEAFGITKKNSVFLEKDIIVRKIFEKMSDSYVFNVSDAEYGWISFSDKSAVTKIGSDNIRKEITIPALIYEKVREEVEKINILYRKLFADLNQMYTETRESPEIFIQASDREIILNLPPDFERHFPKSLLYLTNELEIIITGTPFSVNKTNGKLEIKMKDQL